MQTKHNIARVAILTSGGDSPGMNPCIRAIVRSAIQNNLEVVGFKRGYSGILARDHVSMDSRSVSNIIQRGGTILHTARCAEFESAEGLKEAAQVLESMGVDALFVIGGNGSLRGAHELTQHWSGLVIGLPGTIDNDMNGTDYTIGFDTAVNTAMDSIDKIRDTADAHERFFLIEVMGRKAGDIALQVGINVGAEEILLPSDDLDIHAVCKRLCAGKARGKTSSIIIVAEGAHEQGAYGVAEELQKLSGNEYRVCVLGYLQRGGAATACDRFLATRLGAFAVEVALLGATDAMVGEVGGKLTLTRMEQVWTEGKAVDPWMRSLTRTLAT